MIRQQLDSHLNQGSFSSLPGLQNSEQEIPRGLQQFRTTGTSLFQQFVRAIECK